MLVIVSPCPSCSISLSLLPQPVLQIWETLPSTKQSILTLAWTHQMYSSVLTLPKCRFLWGLPWPCYLKLPPPPPPPTPYLPSLFYQNCPLPSPPPAHPTTATSDYKLHRAGYFFVFVHCISLLVSIYLVLRLTFTKEKTLESPLDSKENKPVNPKGNQPWIFTARTDAKAEAPILWLPDAKNWLTGKDCDACKDWGQEEKGTARDEMVGWHHWLSGHECEPTQGACEGQGSLVCCSSWDGKELDTT